MRDSKKKANNLRYDLQTKSLVFDKKPEKQKNNWQKKAIIYTRVSTEEQKIKWNGINAQMQDCERWAKDNNIQIIGYYKDEAEPWKNLWRKWFIEAISFLEKENKKWVKVDFFICWSTSRFSRNHNVGKSFDMVGRVEATWAKLVAVGNGWIQETDSEEWLISLTLNFMVDALESKRWQKRVRNWQKAKVYEWLRPFPDVPLWYERIIEKVWWKEIKILIQKDPQASIIREWLELFAEWVLLTKQQLHNFFDERWLKSNSKKNKTGKLHESIIDRILDIRKLYVYAGYITYPDRGINELVPAKHQPLINLEIVDKIMRRLYKDWDITNHKKRAYDEDASEYPLKRILLCPKCDKAVTKWKSKSKTWDYHHYYGCNTKWCSLFKKGLPRESVHEAVREKLRSISPPASALVLFEKIFLEERKQAEKDIDVINKERRNKIRLIKDEMDRIEAMLDNITNNQLFEKKQQRRADLNQEKENLEYAIEDIRFTQNEFVSTFNEAKTVIGNPLVIWDLQDTELKQLLIRVCFNNKIYYTKNQGLHTPEISVIYLSLGDLSSDKTPNLEMTGVEPVSKRQKKNGLPQ